MRGTAGRLRGVLTLALIAGVLATATTTVAAAQPEARAADRDCSDFGNQAEAQRYFRDRGGPDSDPDRLDADGDGRACDSLPCPCGTGGGGPTTKPKPRRPDFAARIARVTDGDTIVVRSGSGRLYTVRLIGIDTPEVFGGLECGGKQASASMKRLAAPGRRVRVYGDPTQDRRDRYGRLLAYVKTRGGPQLNIAQVRRGWAKVYVFQGRPFRQTEAFRRAARAAKREGRAVWGRCGGDFHRAVANSLTADPTAGAAARRCGSFRMPGLMTAIRVRVTRGPVPCGRARQVMRRLFRRKRSRVYGWRCVGPQTGYAACTKRGRRIEARF